MTSSLYVKCLIGCTHLQMKFNDFSENHQSFQSIKLQVLKTDFSEPGTCCYQTWTVHIWETFVWYVCMLISNLFSINHLFYFHVCKFQLLKLIIKEVGSIIEVFRSYIRELPFQFLRLEMYLAVELPF